MKLTELTRPYEIYCDNCTNHYVVYKKNNGKITCRCPVCSKRLHTFIETDIDDKDIITLLREDNDTKYILFDDFTVYKDGEELGEFSPSVLANAKTVN